MPYIYHYIGEQILEHSQNYLKTKSGGWVPSRPLGFNSLLHTIKSLWLVLSGRADVVIWLNKENADR